MQIGLLKVRLRIPESESLKGKRRVVKSIVSQVSNKFRVSIAEVGEQELWQIATLGIACVSTDGRHANEILSHVMNFIASFGEDADILDYEIEIVDAF